VICNVRHLIGNPFRSLFIDSRSAKLQCPEDSN
jgi:hypothetical protein